MDGGAAADGGAGPLTDPEIAAMMARASCEYTTRCAPIARVGFEREDACVTRTTGIYARLLGDLQNMRASGRIALDRERLDDCVAEFGRRECVLGPPSGSEYFCPGVLAGLQDVGETCNHSLECRGPFYCPADFRQCATCAPRGREGEACTPLSCADGMLCIAGACVVIGSRGEGEPCAPGECLGQLSCRGPDVNSTCQRATPLDDACDPLDRSVPPCDAYRGEACVEGLCVEPTWTSVGDDCDFEVGPRRCKASYCNPRTSQCDAFTEVGGACDDNRACGPGRICFRGACAFPRMDDEPCDFDQDCLTPRSCFGGLCTALPWMLCP